MKTKGERRRKEVKEWQLRGRTAGQEGCRRKKKLRVMDAGYSFAGYVEPAIETKQRRSGAGGGKGMESAEYWRMSDERNNLQVLKIFHNNNNNNMEMRRSTRNNYSGSQEWGLRELSDRIWGKKRGKETGQVAPELTYSK